MIYELRPRLNHREMDLREGSELEYAVTEIEEKEIKNYDDLIRPNYPENVSEDKKIGEDEWDRVGDRWERMDEEIGEIISGTDIEAGGTGSWAAVYTDADELEYEIRFYVNGANPEKGENLFKNLTEEFKSRELPFQMKTHYSDYERVDNTCVYTDIMNAAHTAVAIGEVLTENPELVDSETASVSKRIYPGVAYAAELGNGKSFHQNQEYAIKKGWGGEGDADNFDVSEYQSCLEEMGIDPWRPHWFNDDEKIDTVERSIFTESSGEGPKYRLIRPYRGSEE